MRAWPHALAGRVTTLVVATALASLALQAAVLHGFVEPALDSLGRSVVHSVNAAHLLLSHAPRAERPRLAAQLSAEGFSVFELPPAGGRAAAPPGPADVLTQAFAQRVRPGITVHLSAHPPNTAAFDFQLDGQAWRIVHHARPPAWGPLHLGLGWLALLAVATAGSLAAGRRWIARPLSHLVGTVRQAEARRRVQLAGVSHDLAAPLTRIRLRAETQCDEAVAQALVDDLAIVQRIADQLIDFMQAEGGLGHGPPAPVRQVAAQVVARYARAGRAVRLAPGGGGDARLPETALQRVLDNLIANALAHATGPVEVTLEQCPGADGGGPDAVLTVWDHGPGLGEADFALAQRPFVRLGPGGHCGLGLAIVAEIAHHLGGRLVARRERPGRFGVALVWPAG